MSAIAFIGFGELARGLAEGLSGGGRHELRAYLRRPPDVVSSEALERLGIRHSSQMADVADGAMTILVAVPGAVSLEVAERCGPLLGPGTLYVDLTSAPPQAKAQGAEIVAARQAEYVDVAVLGTVVVSGHRVPMLASGPGAERFRALVEADGLSVSLLEGPPGQAALVKLLRSVYLKGRDALVVEMMLAARRHGLEQVVVQSVDGPGERVPFEALVERVLCSLALHAGRRSEELAQAAQILDQAGVDPAHARAGARTLHRLAELGLAEAFSGHRPSDASAVLDEIEARWDQS